MAKILSLNRFPISHPPETSCQVTDSFFGIALLVSTFDHSGNLESVDLFGFINITFLFV